MRVRVLLFGPLAARLGRREDYLDLPPGASARAIYDHYARLDAGIGALGRDLQLAINAQFSPLDAPLSEGDEVALLPPMSGGSISGRGPLPGPRPGVPLRAVRAADPVRPGPSGAEPAVIQLVRGPLPAAALRAAVAAPEHGGVVVFEGLTRADHLEGQPVLYLEYEAYEEMALRQMRDLAAAARQRWPIGAIAMGHRLGRVQVGEASVIIAVGAPHRRPAFEACAWAIAELKRSVPIWKRECTAAGSRWAPGTPFAPV